MGIFKKWRKWLFLAILAPLTMPFIGAWTNPKQININSTNLITKDAVTYNNLPVIGYGETPWSPMQLDFQKFGVFNNQTVQRVESAGNNIVLYATGNDDGTNARWYMQDLTRDNEPHQILTNVTNLNWNYDVKIWNSKIIYYILKPELFLGQWIVTKISDYQYKDVIGKGDYKSSLFSFLYNDLFIYRSNYNWFEMDLKNYKSTSRFLFSTATDNFNVRIKNNFIYYIDNKKELKKVNLNFYDQKQYPSIEIKDIVDYWILNNNTFIYLNSDGHWFWHLPSSMLDKSHDVIIGSNIRTALFNSNYLLTISLQYDTPYLYINKLEYTSNINNCPVTKKWFLYNSKITPLENYVYFNNNFYFKGNYLNNRDNKYDFIQRWIEPSHDFNLNVAKITGYGNSNKQVAIDFNFNPSWQDKNYYLRNTDYYLNYWVGNKAKVTRVPLQKVGDNYQFVLANDDLINYDGKTLHATLSANVNGREVNKIKLAHANSLFKYDDINDTYDYNVKNYTPPYWTKARIVGLGVGCVLAIPLLVALFFWLKRQWHKIYF